ncbi:MAG: flagellar export chaperone FliS [Spirochaetota bacterium]
MSFANNTSRNSGYDAYKKNEIATTSPGKLIVMLYDGAIRFLKAAAENMDFKKFDYVNENIQRAKDILDELISSLNLEDGGEVAKNLLSLYIYMNQQIADGNLRKDPKPIQEVLKMLNDLRGAWDEIATKESGTSKQAPISRSGGFSAQG